VGGVTTVSLIRVMVEDRVQTCGRTSPATAEVHSGDQPAAEVHSFVLLLLLLLVLCHFASLKNESVLSFLHTLTMWHCPHSHAAAAGECRLCSSRLISPAHRPYSSKPAADGFTVVGPCWDRQTDKQTDALAPYHCIDTALHTEFDYVSVTLCIAVIIVLL